MNAFPDPQIVDLQITVAHQGKAIEDLSAMIAEQWQTIERLQKKLDALSTRFVALEEQGGPELENTKPPHW